VEDHETSELSGTAALAQYLRTATVLEVLPLPGGGGHGRKRAVYFEGGVGAAAKYGDNASGSTAEAMIRNEVAAWTLADELGWPGLVPTTVLRQLPDPDDSALEVDASVQVLLSRFQTSIVGGFDANFCDETDRLRCAIFDLLCLNSDRNNSNWGRIEDSTKPRLIDHGHAFGTHSSAAAGDFLEAAKGAVVPGEIKNDLQDFIAREANSDLFDILGADLAKGVFERARTLVESGHVTAP
jgi:hypothetical protein